MNDDEKWLEAAAGLEEDILYLKTALPTTASHAVPDLQKSIEYLQMALAIYQKNAAAGIPWPGPDDLFCINIFSSAQVTTGMRRHFKFAS